MNDEKIVWEIEGWGMGVNNFGHLILDQTRVKWEQVDSWETIIDWWIVMCQKP